MDNNTTDQPFNQPVGQSLDQPVGQPVNPPIAEQQPDIPVTPSPIPPQPPIQTTPVMPNYPQPAAMPNVPQPIMMPSTPQFDTAPKSFSIKSIIIAAVSIASTICFFLPWVSVGKVSGNGTDMAGLDYRYIGYFVLIFSVISATIGLLNIAQKLNLIHKICISAINGIAAILAIIETCLLMNDVGEYASISFGLIAIIVTTILAAILPWLPIKESQN